jgi:hypothetical protein
MVGVGIVSVDRDTSLGQHEPKSEEACATYAHMA